MGRRQEAMEVGREAREVPFAGEEPRLGLEKRRASGHGGLAGLPVRVASFPHFRPLNNVSQSVTQEPRVVQDHLLWWPKSDGKEASLSRSSTISMSTSSSSPTTSSDGGGWWSPECRH